MSGMDGYDYQVHEMQMIKDDVESTLKKLQNDILSQLAVQASDSRKYYDQFFARVATLEAKVVSLERLREAQTADAKNLRQRVNDLEGKIGGSKELSRGKKQMRRVLERFLEYVITCLG
jgi:chromosome segregation ATPase